MAGKRVQNRMSKVANKGVQVGGVRRQTPRASVKPSPGGTAPNHGGGAHKLPPGISAPLARTPTKANQEKKMRKGGMVRKK